MNNRQWISVASRDVPVREGRVVRIDGREIALFNLGNRFLAVENTCPHRGGPLSDGIVAGATVVCPLHAWKVNLETGAVERPAAEQACVQTYETRTEGDSVFIQIPLHTHTKTALAIDACVMTGAEPVVESRVG